ncbi:MAG: Hpt domain-containing protein [Myxococcota bacterium]
MTDLAEALAPLPVLDEENVRRIIRLFAEVGAPEEDLVADLLETYRGDVERRMNTFDDAVAGKRLEDATQALHALKGASATVGACRVVELCSQVERRLADGHDLMPGTSGLIRGEAERARQALRQRLQSPLR